MVVVTGFYCLLSTNDFYFIKKIHDENNGFYNKKMDSITLEASFNYFEHLDWKTISSTLLTFYPLGTLNIDIF